MNIHKKFAFCLILLCAVGTACSDEDFVEANRNPDVLNEVSPENQFLSATLSIHSQDFEAFYDTYRRIMPWMQYVTPLNGNGINFTNNVDNFSQRYGRLYTGVGDALTDLERLVEKLPAEEQPRYVHMIAIAHILKAYYAFYVSDIYGSIPYTEAWQARYGGTRTPSYDTQPDLFVELDEQIEEAMTTLKTAQSAPQVSLGNFDQYFRGDITSWLRAGNALRLKIALRQVKRDQARTAQIAQEVLSDAPENLMSSNAQGWVFKATSGFVSGGNWNPDGLYASRPLVDFMWEKNDPRLDALFAPNGYAQDTINVLIDQGDLEAGTTEAARRYFGSFTSPDAAASAANEAYYSPRTAVVNGSNNLIDTLSLIQRRLFQPSFNEGNGAGDGNVNIPVISYAEFCFIRAELAARSATAEDVQTWYEKAVRSSIEWYDQIAREAKLTHYTAVTPTEITDYLVEPGIAFNPALAMDQISSQAYIHYFKQAPEGWALWKRNNLPNTTSVLPLVDMKSNGASLPIPRRAPLPLLNQTSANYENQRAAYDEMEEDPAFGLGPTDAFGRVWWDVP
ncbi:MAG: SusD/RagB family nutrient-binding outer membrane lipoprotein [Bacteroidota bacterium]|nr:SusD/RagB family nutrient-binding outer membrane lipoprotein [Bacteroidota bacterium]